MHRYSRAVLGTGSLAACLALAACGGSGTAAPASPGSAAPSSTAPAVPAGPSAPAASGSTMKAPACKPSQLRVAAAQSATQAGNANGMTTESQLKGYLIATAVITNTSSATCDMDGYPVVDFIGTAGGKTMEVPLLRDTASPKTVVALAPGKQARVSFALHGPSGNATVFKISSILLTPPGASHSAPSFTLPLAEVAVRDNMIGYVSAIG